jgi:mycothione reductase
MKKYDVIVVGSGSGMLIVDEAVGHGLKAALVDKGPYGGTCLNTGCIPSKMLIYPADRIVEIQQAGKLGIKADIKDIDFRAIMQRMRRSIGETRQHIREGVSDIENLDFYEGEGYFTGDRTIEVNGEQIKGENIFLASGSRPFIPPIDGLQKVD